MATAFKPKDYYESDAVKQAQAALQQQLGQKPGAYQSQWQAQLQANMDKILNRPDFKYDLTGDGLYQQYKDQYTQQGKMAMMDTMGQAQAMTGGYGNSYAQSAGQQAYQGYLQGLNDRIPELYQLALSRYQLEGDQLYDKLGLLQQQENQDYGRYQDALSQWQTERDYLAGRYDSERDYDYGKYADDRDFSYSQFVNDRNYAWQQEQAALEQQRWQAEFDEAKRQWEAAQAAKGGGSSGGGGSYAGNGGVDAATVRKAQKFVGATADGMWGSKSQAAAAAKGYSSLSEVIAAMGGSSGGEGPGSAYTDALNDLNAYVAGGASKSEISAYIRDGQSAGVLTQGQANALRDKFLPKGSTY